MRLSNFILVQLLWFSVWLAPAQVQAQVQQNAASDTANVIPADSVLPGQKHPFTDAQRLEGSDSHFLKRAVIPASVLIAAGLYTIHGHGIISSFDTRDLRNRKFGSFSTKIDNYLFFTPMAGLFAFDLFSFLFWTSQSF